MPRSRGEHKERLISTRVKIAEAVQSAADSEGLTISEWMRNLIIKELKARKLIGEGVKLGLLRGR